MTAKYDWATLETMFDLGGYAVGAALTDRAALLALVALTEMRPEHEWQGYDDFDDVETAVDDAIAQIMDGVSGEGDMIKIAEAVATEDCADLTIDDLGTDAYSYYVLMISGLRSDRNYAFDHVLMQLSGSDTVSDYYQEDEVIYGTTKTATEGIGSLAGIKLRRCCAGALAAGSAFAAATITMYNPQSAADKKVLQWDAVLGEQSTGRITRMLGTGFFKGRDEIDEIKILPENGTEFKIDSVDDDLPSELRMTLYGLG